MSKQDESRHEERLAPENEVRLAEEQLEQVSGGFRFYKVTFSPSTLQESQRLWSRLPAVQLK